MRTSRKTICKLVVVLTAVIGYLGVSPANVQAAVPDVSGPWQTTPGDNAQLSQFGPGNRYVSGSFMGPYGWVQLNGSFLVRYHAWDPWYLRLHVDGVQYDGEITLKVKPDVGGRSPFMDGKVKLEGIPLPIKWTWRRY